jgi:arabinan endo-1,5-alpha-L-arabinosidase
VATDIDRPQPLFSVEVAMAATGWTFAVCEGDGEVRRYRLLNDFTQSDFAALLGEIGADFGFGLPQSARLSRPWPQNWDILPLLRRNLHPDLLYGYGDPAVLRVGEMEDPAYVLIVTSNDAPDAFPILRSRDAHHWNFAGCAFAKGSTPAWAAVGKGKADFWAPEIHRVGEGYWLCFTARDREGGLAIGLATAEHHDGPFRAADAPLLEGEVIDAHLLVDCEAGPYLVWKEDRNGLWPSMLLEGLARDPAMPSLLFGDEAACRTARFFVALAPWIGKLTGMRRFVTLHPLIEAVTADFKGFNERVAALSQGTSPMASSAARIADALTTRIVAQRMDTNRRELTGERHTILRNDQEWEAHLVEGPWIHRHDGTYYLFYAGNDFSTERYGIGCAVADAPLGPYRKLNAPFLQSSSDWLGPGHPSVAIGPNGDPYLFFHAYHPGATGYGAFRALLRARLELTPSRVAIGCRR